MKTGRRRTGATVALAVGLAASAQGATITVNATADSLAIDGNCTLREAIIAANTDAAVDACAPGSGADVVMLPAGTYVLTLVGAEEDAAATGDLDITADLEIAGAGATSTIIDGNGTDRVLDVDPASTGLTVRVSGVTIQNGGGVEEGGGVRNGGSLVVADSVVQANAVAASGAFPNSASSAGGGIRSSSGNLRLERCVVRDNTAETLGGLQSSAHGGGIFAAVVDVVDSTITANRARVELSPNSFALGGRDRGRFADARGQHGEWERSGRREPPAASPGSRDGEGGRDRGGGRVGDPQQHDQREHRIFVERLRGRRGARERARHGELLQCYRLGESRQRRRGRGYPGNAGLPELDSRELQPDLRPPHHRG